MLLSVYCFSSTNIFDIVFEMVSNAHILAMMVNSIEHVYLYTPDNIHYSPTDSQIFKFLTAIGLIL
jgi:hypothetical protein